jgi:hypothetical protein
MADLHANEGICLHQSQAFYWATRGNNAPLAWVKMLVEFAKVGEGKKSGTSCLKQSWLGQCLLELELCFGSKQLRLQCSFLKASVEYLKQLGWQEGTPGSCLADSPLLKAPWKGLATIN